MILIRRLYRLSKSYNVRKLSDLQGQQKELVRPLILGIETSCDDTGVAVVDGAGTIHSEALHSQLSVHLKRGGIVPPVARDLHIEHIDRIVNEAITNSGYSVNDFDAIAVTNRPGLSLSLLIGLGFAKRLATDYSKPLIPIHHMEGHALTARREHEVKFPFLCLLISGGHCLLTYVKDVEHFHLLGTSIDDAPGEAFDKTARLLNLGNIPEFEWLNGGRSIELAALRSKCPNRFKFNLPLWRYRDCQFSFAGLKNAVRRHYIRSQQQAGLTLDDLSPEYEDLCSGFLRAVTRHICHRTQRAMEFLDVEKLMNDNRTLVVSGGVACNDFIFTAVSQMAEQMGYNSVRPSKKHCTDNGVMIAWNGVERWKIDSEKYQLLNFDDIDIYHRCPLDNSWIDRIREASLKCKWLKIPILPCNS